MINDETSTLIEDTIDNDVDLLLWLISSIQNLQEIVDFTNYKYFVVCFDLNKSNHFFYLLD